MKYLLITICRKILAVFFLFPIKTNRIIFTSYNGKQYSCNPKAIYEHIIKKNQDNIYNLELIWAFTDVEQFTCSNLESAKTVRYKSFKYIYYVLTSKVVIENSESWSIIPKRHGQIVINTWHGGGAYKKVGKSRIDGSRYNDKNVEYKNDRVNIYVSSSEVFTKTTLRKSFGYSGDVLEIGMPRNDMLLQNDVNKYKSIKRSLGIYGKNIVIIAPTFRNKTDFRLESFDFDKFTKALQDKFGGEWVILYRSHYYESPKSNLNKAKIIDVSTYHDMQDLLYISDVLVTDFSSSMWDFSLMKRPIFLFSSELEDYQELERGFYTPPDSWPFPLATNFQDFIKNVEAFDEKMYIDKLNKHHAELGSKENGEATKIITDLIFDEININNYKMKGLL